MQTNRREFLKLGVGASAAAGASALGFSIEEARAAMRELKISRAKETHSVCPYCAVGCGMIAYTLGDGAKNAAPTVVHVEGDPDSPINAGTLCPKGASTMQLTVNRRRMTAPLYRAAGATDWNPISWDDMLDKIAQRIKDTRDRTFVTVDAQGRTVNRQEGFASIGGATFSNEEGHLMTKLFRSLGTVFIEQQARV